MREVGVSELKAHASAILREVREHGARYVVTLRGKPVATLVPVDNAEAGAAPAAGAREAMEELLRLGHEATRHWTSEKSGVELLSEMRR